MDYQAKSSALSPWPMAELPPSHPPICGNFHYFFFFFWALPLAKLEMWCWHCSAKLKDLSLAEADQKLWLDLDPTYMLCFQGLGWKIRVLSPGESSARSALDINMILTIQTLVMIVIRTSYSLWSNDASFSCKY